MEILLKMLQGIRGDIDFENEENLIDNGILGSFDVIQIVAEIDDKFEISIPAQEIIPRNFNSMKNIWEMIQRMQ